MTDETVETLDNKLKKCAEEKAALAAQIGRAEELISGIRACLEKQGSYLTSDIKRLLHAYEEATPVTQAEDADEPEAVHPALDDADELDEILTEDSDQVEDDVTDLFEDGVEDDDEQ